MYIYKILRKEIQFLLPILISLFLFFSTNIIGVCDISELAYWSKKMLDEPLRIVAYSFVHVDFNHLLSNIFGVSILRYCLITLNSRNNSLFLLLILFIVPIQTIYLYLMDNYLFYANDNLLVGLSGVIYGSYSFLMLSSFFGNKNFFKIHIGLTRNMKIFNLLSFLLVFGMIYSFLPGISLNGHFAGFISGIIIFYLSSKCRLFRI